MQFEIYQVAAFTDAQFGGNPAAVVPLDEWIDASLLQKIAAENNLSETAFFVPVEDGVVAVVEGEAGSLPIVECHGDESEPSCQYALAISRIDRGLSIPHGMGSWPVQRFLELR